MVGFAFQPETRGADVIWFNCPDTAKGEPKTRVMGEGAKVQRGLGPSQSHTASGSALRVRDTPASGMDTRTELGFTELRLSLRLHFWGKMLFMYLEHVQAGGGAEGRRIAGRLQAERRARSHDPEIVT